MNIQEFLPGVDAAYVLERFALAGGNEVESGKLQSLESSAALAANCFAWFNHRPHLLPPFLGLPLNYPALSVDIEYRARLPWSGGRHPWLDAMITTTAEIIGVESKRFEPFRSSKRTSISEAYDRPVWGDRMEPFQHLRDQLRSGEAVFRHLDAAQLLKHALGLLAEGKRTGKAPFLVYLHAEPAFIGGRPIPLDAISRHREEVVRFGQMIAGSEVCFAHTTYREWLSTWIGAEPDTSEHASRLLEAFKP